MYVGVQGIGTSKIELEFLRRHGVTHMDSNADAGNLDELVQQRETAAAAGVLLAVFPVVFQPLDGLIYPMPLVLFALMSLVLLALDPWITAATAGRAWAASLILVAAISLLHDICMPPQRIADGLLVFADARMHMLLPASALGMGVVHSLQPLKVAERAAAALIFGVFISCSALAAHAHTSEPRALLIFTYIVPPFIVGIACGEASKF